MSIDGIIMQLEKSSPRVNREISEILKQSEIRPETAQFLFREAVILEWMLAIGSIKEGHGKDGWPKFEFVKRCDKGRLYCTDQGLMLQAPGDVSSIKIDDLLLRFLQVRAYSFRIRNTEVQAAEGWILWRVLVDMIKRGEVKVRKHKRKLKLTLVPHYLAEVRMLGLMRS